MMKEQSYNEEQDCDILEFDHLNHRITLSDKYYCKICQFVYNDVCQHDCGCRSCSTCNNISDGKCVICGKVLIENKKYVDKAFQKELNNHLIECKECTWNGKFKDYKQHYVETHKSFRCKYCKTPFDSVSYLKIHMEENPNGRCRSSLVCKFNAFGCDEQNMTNANEHYKENAALHLNSIYTYLLNASPKIQENFCINMNTVSNNISAEQASLNDVYTLQDTNFSIKQRLIAIYLQEETLLNENELSKRNVSKLKDRINLLKKILMLTKAKVVELEQRVFDSAAKSYGFYLWKITDVAQKVLDAKSGKQTSFYSPPFYSHPNGYKMCARIYLNGDGMGRGTHMSIFFVLMKGEYDTLLGWPFRQKVSFILIDQLQSESKENIVDAFRPDPKSLSFTVPASDMNIASGIPLFCSLPKLHSPDHQYIKEDVMFIKIVVDSRELKDV